MNAYQLAQPILEYFAATYGRMVWVVKLGSENMGWRAWMLDFSSTEDNPFYAERIPEHERPWIRLAVMHDGVAYNSAEKGYRWFWFLDDEEHLLPVTSEYPTTI